MRERKEQQREKKRQLARAIARGRQEAQSYGRTSMDRLHRAACDRESKLVMAQSRVQYRSESEQQQRIFDFIRHAQSAIRDSDGVQGDRNSLDAKMLYIKETIVHMAQLAVLNSRWLA